MVFLKALIVFKTQTRAVALLDLGVEWRQHVYQFEARGAFSKISMLVFRCFHRWVCYVLPSTIFLILAMPVCSVASCKSYSWDTKGFITHFLLMSKFKKKDKTSICSQSQHFSNENYIKSLLGVIRYFRYSFLTPYV